VYERLFANLASTLPRGGRLYLQTMVFGRNMIPVEQVSRNAPRESDAWYLAMMQAAFPGSFLPFGKEHVVRCAEPHFRLVSAVSGRLDYIQTIREWDKRTEAWNPRMALLKLRLIPKWLTSPDFRFAFTAGESSNLVCFERELMDHYRLVFERT
jgi:cyclopropane-fatty-acyl-phospholipid synthase